MGKQSVYESYLKTFAPQVTSKPNMGEIASTEDYNQMLKGTIIPYNPDSLLGRKGFHMYDQMRIDDQVKACLTLKKFATISPGYEIVQASDEKQDIEVADFVRYTLDKAQGSVTDYLLEILTALDFGFSITEINYKQYKEGKYEGKIGLKNLKTKAPYNYSFAQDKYANLLKDGIVYSQGANEQFMPTSKFILFSYQKEFGNHYGTSDLRPAYRAYWSKDVLIKMWNIYLERFANPTVVGKYKSNDPSGKANLRNILDNLTAKTSITHRQDEFDISFLESGRSATNDFATALNFYNRSIARSILIPDRLMAEGDTGAYSQAKVHFDVFLWVIQKLRQDIEETIVNEQLIKKLVSYNFSNVEELPKFVFNPITDDQKIELQTLFVAAVQHGVVTPTLEDENLLRKQLHFPEKEFETPPPDEVIKDVPDEVAVDEIEESYAYRPEGAERRVNFKKVDDTLTLAENSFEDDVRAILTSQRDQVVTYVAKKLKTNSFGFKAIDNLELKNKSQLNKTFKQFYKDMFAQGIKEGKTELPKKYITSNIGEGLTGEELELYLESKSRTDVRSMLQRIDAKLVDKLVEAVRNGSGISVVQQEINLAFAPYTDDGTSLNQKGRELTSYNLKTIARTATLGAYNMGRRAVAEDSELEDFIIGLGLSPVLDSKTSEICQDVGRIRPKVDITNKQMINKLTPPLHYNCRTIIYYITKEDAPVAFTPPQDLDFLSGISQL